MEEHSDDLEPVVYEQAEQETQGFPNTGDELDHTPADDELTDEEVDEIGLDADMSEL